MGWGPVYSLGVGEVGVEGVANDLALCCVVVLGAPFDPFLVGGRGPERDDHSGCLTDGRGSPARGLDPGEFMVGELVFFEVSCDVGDVGVGEWVS